MALTSSWTAVKVGQIAVSDIFLVALFAWMVFLALARARSLPLRFWTFAPAVAGILCLVVHSWFPTNILLNLTDSSPTVALGRTLAATTLTACALGWLVAVGGAALGRRLTIAWLAGVTINAAVAVGGGPAALGLGQLVPTPLFNERAAGLATHPNSLACALAVAIPVALWACLPGFTRLGRIAALLALLLIVQALLLANSRAGISAGMAILLLAGGWAVVRTVQGPLRYLVVIAFAAATTLTALNAVDGTRLDSEVTSTGQSDFIRGLAVRYGLELFAEHPVFGVGLNAGNGISVPVLLLSAGGIVLFSGYYLFVIGCFRELWMRRSDTLAVAAALTLACGMIFQVFNNGNAERYLFVVPVLAAFSCVRGAAMPDAWPRSRGAHRSSAARSGKNRSAGKAAISAAGSH